MKNLFIAALCGWLLVQGLSLGKDSFINAVRDARANHELRMESIINK